MVGYVVGVDPHCSDRCLRHVTGGELLLGQLHIYSLTLLHRASGACEPDAMSSQLFLDQIHYTIAGNAQTLSPAYVCNTIAGTQCGQLSMGSYYVTHSAFPYPLFLCLR
jgi:hypothetical protein